jgi:hypothetical protein
MKWIRIGIAVALWAVLLTPAAHGGRNDSFDPALVQPPLNPTFAPWGCWRAGNRTICEAVKIETYVAEDLDFLDCAAGTYVETFSLSPDGSGPTLRSFGRSQKVFVYGVPRVVSSRTETISGLEARVTAPGSGVLLLDAGVKSWDDEGNLLKAGGLHAFLDDDEFEAAAARICAAFDRLGG